MQKLSLTLSPHEAMEAIYRDLHRYGPQTMLCAELLRSALNDSSAVKREPGQDGLWIRRGHHQQMQYLEGSALINHICAVLGSGQFSAEQIAALCRRVFQTTVKVVESADSSAVLIRIATGMASFRCHMCGHCCQNLDYHKEVAPADVDRWRTQDRNDILKWVGITKGAHQQVRYQIWVTPGTNQFAETCPFLKKGNANNQWVCSIQETKPEICRQYPFTRKHAIMTGCLGFK